MARDANRSRTVRGLMNEIANGSFGSRSYCVPGNSVELPRTNGVSSLLNDRLGWRT